MSKLKLTNLLSCRQYFQAIATAHKQIAGFKWGDEDVIRNDSRSDAPDSFLWAQPYERFPYFAADSDNIIKRKKVKVAYLKVRTSEKFSNIDADYDAAEAIIEQIMARLLRDKRGMDVAGVWEQIATRFSSWYAGPIHVTLGSTEYLGFELEIEFQDNTNMEYDATKWDA